MSRKKRTAKVEREKDEQADPPMGKEVEIIIMRDGFKYFVPE